MIIVCYRDNEVSIEHPLTLSLNKIIQRGGRVTQLNLKGLDPESTAQMLGHIQNGSGYDVCAGGYPL